MNIMIASDVHGSSYYCAQMLDAFAREQADRLLLGDILYHGPRNDLPRDYAPKKVIEQLNALRRQILCVRGNCDTEVDQMVLTFPILADYAVLFEQRTIYATHGHRFGEQTPPPMQPCDVLLCGHTHVPKCTEHTDFLYLNPGSVSIPKEGSARGYMTWEDGVFQWKTLEGEVYHSLSL